MQIPQRDCVGSCSSEGGSGGVEVRALVGTPAAGMKEGTQARSRKNRSRPGSLEIRRCRGLGLIGTPAAEGRRGHCLGTGKQLTILGSARRLRLVLAEQDQKQAKGRDGGGNFKAALGWTGLMLSTKGERTEDKGWCKVVLPPRGSPQLGSA
eukprot:1156603-Pelagomonas_calceolata.AAC.4